MPKKEFFIALASGEHQQVSSLESRGKLPQQARRQNPLVSHRTTGIEKDDIEIALHG
jgi:hypothetical protein